MFKCLVFAMGGPRHYYIGFEQHKKQRVEAPNVVIKAHHANQGDSLREEADKTFVIYRDIRDAFSSAKYMWGVKNAVDWTQNYLDDFYYWSKYADLILRYEDIMRDKVLAVKNMCGALGVKPKYEDIVKIAETRRVYEGGRHRRLGGGSHWRKRLEKDEIQDIERVAGPWLKEYGYDSC
jgi:hypothetical protein